MATKYLDSNGLLYFWGKIKAAFVSDVKFQSNKIQKVKNGSTTDVVGLATTATSGLMSSTDKATLDGIVTTGGEPNQNAWSNISVGGNTLAADSKTDTFTILAGDNITLASTVNSDTFKISATDTKYQTFSSTSDGLVPKPSYNDPYTKEFLFGDGQWDYLTANSNSYNVLGNEYMSVDLKRTKNSTVSLVSFRLDSATTASPGILTSADKIKLNNMESTIDTKIAQAAIGGASFQGTVSAGTEISSLTAYSKGWYWVVGTAGTYVGQTCEVGDMIFCISDYNSAYSASDFSVVQNNMDIASVTNAQIDTIVAN